MNPAAVSAPTAGNVNPVSGVPGPSTAFLGGVPSRALKDACEALHIKGQAQRREMIAKRIVDLARKGIIEPKALRDRVIAEAKAVDQDPTTRLHGRDTLVSAVKYEGQVCGALVIHGIGTDGVKIDYAEAAARVASGLVVSLSGSGIRAA